MKDVNIKSSAEVVGEKAVNYRSYCQVTNLGVSLALLGLIIPIFTRRNTKRKHEQALKLAQEQSQSQTDNKKSEPKIGHLYLMEMNTVDGILETLSKDEYNPTEEKPLYHILSEILNN